MRLTFKSRNFILYLLLCLLLLSGIHEKSVSIQNSQQFPAQQTSQSLCAASFSAPVDFWTEQVSQRRASSPVTNIVRASRTVSVWRVHVLFLFCILTFLSVFSHFVKKILMFRDNRYVYQEAFLISYIQNTDGRKRISYLYS